MPTPDDRPPRVKGAILNARLKFVRDKGGEAALEKVLARLSKQDQETLRGWVLSITWYPLDLELRLDDAIAEVLSPGDHARVFLDMGRESAQVNLTGAQAPYVKPGDPHFFLGNVPRMYTAYHSGGRRTYERKGERSAVICTLDAERVTANDCLTVTGWLERALELSGAKEPRVTETQCRARGAPHCEHRCEW